jgi:transposase InsO family protein
MPQREITDLIRKIYYAPGTGYQGAARTLAHLRRAYPDVAFKLKDVREFIQAQEVAQLHRPKERVKTYRPITAQSINEEWQADLIDLPKLVPENNGYRYILTMCDIFSRHAWVIPLKGKTGKEVAAALKKHFDDEGVQPSIWGSDSGKEFKNKDVLALFKERNIAHHFSESGDHNHMGIIERFNKTLKVILTKYQSATGRKNWVNVIKDIVEGYNNSKHRTTKVRPIDAAAGVLDPQGSLQGRPQGNVSEGLPIGATVRLLLNSNVFTKGYAARWSKGTFTITGEKGNRYVVQNDKGETMGTSWKPYELQIISTVEKAPRGDREIADLRETFTQHAPGKRKPKRKEPYDPTTA